MTSSQIQGRHRNKVHDSVMSALSTVKSGSSIMVGGFGLCGNPEGLIAGVLELGVSDLTIISNNSGNLGKGLATWLKAGVVSRVICSYIGNNEDLHRLKAEGSVEVQINPQGTLVERIRSAGAGIPAFYTPTGVGTVVAEGKEVKNINGRDYLLEHALSADFAFIRGVQGDTFGNLRFWRTARNYSPVMATAARTTIAEVDTLVDVGEIGPDDVHLPGIFVHRVVEVTDHENPFEYRTVRSRD
ncbi:MAG: succinyl-CoA--3-ketoacid-CoA transferase [Myxococcales bacterium]|nr:succinyl-CoA--3-ketoacid-CoA transferase [Myxococcales bacterium]